MEDAGADLSPAERKSVPEVLVDWIWRRKLLSKPENQERTVV